MKRPTMAEAEKLVMEAAVRYGASESYWKTPGYSGIFRAEKRKHTGLLGDWWHISLISVRETGEMKK